MATPCTNLLSLQLQHTTINSARTTPAGSSSSPDQPPTTIAGLPAFCRVTATLTPSSDSSIKIEVWLPESGWNGRFLGTGGGGFQGVITYNELAAWPQGRLCGDQQRSRHRFVRMQSAVLRFKRQHGQCAGGCVRRSGGAVDRPVRASRADQGFRLPGDPPDDRARQGNRQRLLRAKRGKGPILPDAPPAARTP